MICFLQKKAVTSYKLEPYIIWRKKKEKKNHFRQIKTGVVPGIQKKRYVKF